MTKYKLFVAVSILSVTSLFFLLFVNVVYLQEVQKKEDKAKSKEFCSLLTDELKFCTDKRKIIVTSRNLITLNFSFTNLSIQEMYVSRFDGSNYIFKVTDENGEKILTRLERKMRDDVLSGKEETGFISSLVSNHRSVLLPPNEIYNEKISLSSLYDFTKAGKYYVEVIKRMRNPNGEGFLETSLDKIEIEVKDEIK